jgi:hypothetical protein
MRVPTILLYVTLILPQYAYLSGAGGEVRRGQGISARAYRKLSYYTLGYISKMQRCEVCSTVPDRLHALAREYKKFSTAPRKRF